MGKHEREPFLQATLLALRGWGGMVEQIEARGDRVVQPVPRGSLVEFLAVRLLLDRFALADTAREALGFTGPLAMLRGLAAFWPPSVEQRAFPVFQLAQVRGLSPDVLHRLSRSDWATVLQEIESFTALERRRVFHLAYERRFYTQTLDAISLHARKPAASPAQPRFQAIFCLDEREESIRRHIEELAPDAETLSTAGFFSIAMYFRGAADAHFVPLCPAVMRPKHWVVERVIDQLEPDRRRRARTRRALGIASHRFHTGSRSLTVGAVLTAAVGVLASIPLVARTLFPRLTSQIRQRFGTFVNIPPTDPPGAGADRPDPGARGRAPGLHARRDDRHRGEGPPGDRPDRAVRPAGPDPRPRLDEHEQSPRVGARLRRLRRRPGRPQRPRPGPDPQRPARPRSGCPAAGSSIPR